MLAITPIPSKLKINDYTVAPFSSILLREVNADLAEQYWSYLHSFPLPPPSIINSQFGFRVDRETKEDGENYRRKLHIFNVEKKTSRLRALSNSWSCYCLCSVVIMVTYFVFNVVVVETRSRLRWMRIYELQ